MSNLTFDFRAGDAIYEYDESPPDRTGRDCDIRPADHSDGQQGCYKKSQLVSKKFKRQLHIKLHVNGVTNKGLATVELRLQTKYMHTKSATLGQHLKNCLSDCIYNFAPMEIKKFLPSAGNAPGPG